jgi:drug/metabolite transporter (DMT)-like permease
MTSSRIRAYILLIIVAAIWGFAGPVIKYTLPDFPPIIFLTYRFAISLLILIPVTISMKQSLPKNKKDIFILTLVGLLGSSINLGLLFYGYNYTTALDASLLSATAPIFVVAASAFVLKEKVTKNERLGVFITFIGAITIILQPLAEGGLFTFKNIYGNLLIIAANMAWVLYVVLSKYELKQKVKPLLMTTYTFFLGFITLLPLAIFQSGGISNLFKQLASTPVKPHLGVWYMAILSGALAYFLYQKAQKSIEASEATLFSYLSPLFAAPLAVFWLGELLTPTFLLGSVIIALGVFIAEFKKRSYNKT